jgi:hypothetical protein
VLHEMKLGLIRFWGLRWRWKGPIIAFILFGLIGIVSAAAEGSDDEKPEQASAADTPAVTATGAAAKAPTNSPTTKPTSTPTPQPTPTPTPVPPPPPLSGTGQTATEPVTLAPGVWVITLRHGGQRNIIVKAFDSKGSSELIVNEIGRYEGSSWLAGNETYRFDVQADGGWSIAFAQIALQPEAADSFAGTSAAVSGIFPAGKGPVAYAFTHDGRRNFIVHLQCDKGGGLIQNEIGAVSGSRIVTFDGGARVCFWTVKADGGWSITRKQ